ncbi:class E sortase [Streptoverticillium reticulum]|uniref:class E sortase n=1 Tax=Streptoverticillium reticulum TaxID=1433415 RepID=UPI0039C000AB
MRLRLVVRTLSELCLTIGTLIVLFVVYVLYWTGVRADRAMDGEIGRLREQWSAGSAARPAAPSPPAGTAGTAETAGTAGTAETQQDDGPSAQPRRGAAGQPGAQEGQSAPQAHRDGAPFAVMYIPRFGSGWAKPVLEGTGTELLKKGLGHYDRTAAPGATGNFAVAGHRRTYGDPFKDFPGLRPGDAVVLTDGAAWYTYRLDTRPYTTLPDDTGVVDPVPAHSGYRGPGRYLTLTTCEPEWGHSHRLIVWGHLEETRPVEEGKPKALPG